jgi:hypothetical protein
MSRFLAINIEEKIGQLTVRRTSSFITTKYTAVQNMDETIPDVGFSIIGNIHICITTNDHK